MKKIFTTLLYILLIGVFDSGTVFTQTVSTFLSGSGLNGPDGFAIDTTGNLYVANWGGGSGNNVLKITPGGTVTTFATGFNAPDGLVFDANGYLYVSNYASGIISKVSPSGVSTVFATGLINPSALAFDSQGNLYVSNYGGNTVSKITPAGVVSTFATGFNAPLGLAFDSEWNLYVSNYNSGVINKVNPSGVVTVFASISNSPQSRIQYLLFGRTGNLYVPAYGHNKIYKITPVGVVSVLTGTGVAGGTNGPLDSATFNGPNSIAMNKFGEIYISEYNANRIRKIIGVEPPVLIRKENEILNYYKLYQNYPNPFNPTTNIKFSLPKSGFVELRVYDILGKEIMTLVNEKLQAGEYEITFNRSGLSNGIYFYKLETEKFSETKKMILIK
ncbi:MAG: T9SS type A sorting domain-containing protein [Ignavibacteria bacterium]|jgi:sugar lactone lactonase YvrE